MRWASYGLHTAASIEVSCDARSYDAGFHRAFLCRGISLRQSLPKTEVAMDSMTLIALAVSLLLLIYLTASLLYPEKF